MAIRILAEKKMNKQRILELAEYLFKKHPLDLPEKLFQLATSFVEYEEAWIAQNVEAKTPFDDTTPK